jgi:hypothetical protein
MTPGQFIAKWRASSRNEWAASQQHFLDLCALLDEPTPNSDPTGAAYAFEKGATKASGGEAGRTCGGAGGSLGNTRESCATCERHVASFCNMPARWKTRPCW